MRHSPTAAHCSKRQGIDSRGHYNGGNRRAYERGPGYHDRQIPALEIEMHVATHPRLGHRPLPADRGRAGRELLLALWGAVLK